MDKPGPCVAIIRKCLSGTGLKANGRYWELHGTLVPHWQSGVRLMQLMPPKALAWIVEGLRYRAGLSQTALARKCSITLRTIQRLEAGDPVARSTRRALAAAFREGDAGIFDNPEFIALASRLYRESQNARTAVISRILVDGGSVARSPYPL